MANGDGTAFLKQQITKFDRRIKSIRENPDPSKPKSNLLLYECERDVCLEQLNALREGKPISNIMPGPITRALGFVPRGRPADAIAPEQVKTYFEKIRKEEIAEYTCDRTVLVFPLILGGDFPKLSLLVPHDCECTPVYLSQLLMAHLLNVPCFVMDRHLDSYRNLMEDDKLKYTADQFGELIEFAEAKIPGCKYDEDKLIEIQYHDRQFLNYQRQIWELRKRIPCPVSGKDAFREPTFPHAYPNPAKAVEYMRQCAEEIGEKAERGIGAVEGEEKLRLLWSVSGPYYVDPFAWLAKRGVAVPAVEMTSFNERISGRSTYYGDLWNGRKLTPLEEEGRQLDMLWGRLGKESVKSHIDTCRDLKLEGIVYFLQWGCSVSNNLGKIVADAVERELGIPTLLIEGRMSDQSMFDEKDFFSRLEEFVGICLQNKRGA